MAARLLPGCWRFDSNIRIVLEADSFANVKFTPLHSTPLHSLASTLAALIRTGF